MFRKTDSLLTEINDDRDVPDKVVDYFSHYRSPLFFIPVILMCISIAMIAVGSTRISDTCDMIRHASTMISIEACWIVTGTYNIFLLLITFLVLLYPLRNSDSKNRLLFELTILMVLGNVAFFGWDIWAMSQAIHGCIQKSGVYMAMFVAYIGNFIYVMLFLVAAVTD